MNYVVKRRYTFRLDGTEWQTTARICPLRGAGARNPSKIQSLSGATARNGSVRGKMCLNKRHDSTTRFIASFCINYVPEERTGRRISRATRVQIFNPPSTSISHSTPTLTLRYNLFSSYITYIERKICKKQEILIR